MTDSVAVPTPSMRGEVDFVSARSLKRELLAELAASNESHRSVRPEDLLVRWPTDAQTDPDVASLLFADYQQRRSHGEAVRSEEYDEQYPEHKDSLSRLFRQHEMFRSLGASGSVPATQLVLPNVGDEVFGFVLRHELGSGAFARVFLAEQGSLAGRPVVVKTSDRTGDEPQTLAQLQHTHIVPIYSVHEDLAAGLRAVCMPYFGGASLSAVLQAVWAKTERATAGEQLVEALTQVQAPTLDELNGRNVVAPSKAEERQAVDAQSPRAVLRKLSYARAAAWIVARLAEGLQHAHQRGVLHRDIKPSNILLGADGQPMLLDFNLSQSQLEGAEAVLGGTVAYMAPEHLRAMNARTANLMRQVDARSDIYSLGMVLYEILTGHNPFDQSGSYSPMPVMVEAMAVERSRGAPSLRQRRPNAPWGLESIVRKCMAPSPAARYQQAEHLAEDLRRFLADDPLRYAPELSLVERGQKWVRRHPRLTSSGMVAVAAAVLLTLSGTAIVGAFHRLKAAGEQIAENASQKRKQAYQDGTVQALLLVNTNTELSDHLREGLRVCEETLGLYGVLERDDWQEEENWRRLTDEERRRLGEDTRELLLLLAWAKVRIAPGDQAVVREALRLLDKAEIIADLPASPALWQDRASYRRQLGDATGANEAAETARRTAPANARDHYLLATAYARSGAKDGRANAVRELDRSIELNPRYYWAWFQRGVLHQKSGSHHLAAADFGACVGLWPEFAWGHFNLGCAHERNGLREEAVRAYTAALERDGEFADAYLNRGMSYLSLGRPAEALADFTKAVALRPGDASLHAGRGMALANLGRNAEADEAFLEAFSHIDVAPAEVQERIRCGYAFAVSGRRPDAAGKAFDDVLARHPDHPEALYGRAALAAAQGRAADAVGFLERAVAAAPTMMEARRHLAIQLARCGRFAEAFRAVNWCLEREPTSGPTLYSAACVAALAAERSRGTPAGKECATKAIAFLRAAFANGHRRDKAATDGDLAGIRGEAEFVRLMGQTTGARP